LRLRRGGGLSLPRHRPWEPARDGSGSKTIPELRANQRGETIFLLQHVASRRTNAFDLVDQAPGGRRDVEAFAEPGVSRIFIVADTAVFRAAVVVDVAANARVAALLVHENVHIGAGRESAARRAEADVLGRLIVRLSAENQLTIEQQMALRTYQARVARAARRR
jgi:hypothetical protein